MDAFLVKAIVAELARELRGALVSRIHQPADREIVLTLWTGREEKRLLVSADVEMCRIHLSTRKVPAPPTPPRLCQYLRRHLEGMRIAGLAVKPFDRAVRIDFAASRPDAEHDRTTLHAELYGRHANLIYADGNGVILDTLRTVSHEESRVREVAPGLPYRPLPPPERILLPDVAEADAERLFTLAWEGLARALQRDISGLGPELAREAAERGKESPAVLFREVRDLVRRYEEDDFEPGIGTLPSGKTRVLPFPCPHAGFASFERFESANGAADRYYGEAAAAKEFAVLKQQVRSRLTALLKKERQKLENVGGDEERLREGLAGGEKGEILKASLSALRKGMTAFRDIPLDPAKTPVENMNRYFSLHKKAKRSVGLIHNRKRDVAETVYYLESLEIPLDEAKSREDLFAVRQELSAAFPPKGAPSRKTAGKPKAGRPPGADAGKLYAPQVDRTEFRGHMIFVGKNNTGNDRIVKELAAPDDLWLHAQGIPGSHVLVKRRPGQEIPREVLEEAARLAVLHSKAKGSSNVPVFLAEARHVSKFKGAKPGLVRIARYETINVR
jgi:predicted ribosome quality control (RQC) complex YloA/Tae2 family protein